MRRSLRLLPLLLCAVTLAWGQPKPGAAPPAQTGTASRDPNIRITRRQPAPVVDADVKRGYEALQGGRYGEARGAYEQALKRDGALRDALIGLAWSLEGLEDHQAAQGALRRLLELYPRDAEALAAQYLLGGGIPGDAAARFKQLAERGERNAPLHFALGVIHAEQNRWGEARLSFERAVALEPAQPDYLYNLALALDRLGQGPEAMRVYVRALNLSFRQPAAFNPEAVRARVRALAAPAS
jgi:tetratricopeptide (TPR) repeat protein